MVIPKNCLIYGSTGYTGNIIARLAVKRGLKPILAGRDVDKVGRQAAELGLEWRAFRLSNRAAIERALNDTGLVLLIAGPYQRTSAPVVAACLRTGAHYLDITGELDVYQALAAQDAAAKAKQIMLGTGMGFDVVPTDCLASYLKTRLPGAIDLKLAFTTRGPAHMSHGTLKSGLGQLDQGLQVRRDGKLAQVKYKAKSLVVDFGWGPRSCDLFSWGDVVTAYYSTGIPNIEVYNPANPALQRLLSLGATGRKIFGPNLSRRFGDTLITLLPSGSSPAQRAKTQCVVWGQVTDQSGQRRAARLSTMDAYEFTAQAALHAVEKVLAGEIKPGFQTPAMAFGADFVLEIEGVTRQDC